MRRKTLAALPLVLAIVTVLGCGPSATTTTSTGGTCSSSTGPAFLFGSKDLTPTIGMVTTTTTSTQTLYVPLSSGSGLSLDLPGGPPILGDVFELRVVTSPPAKNTHLGVDVTGVLKDPDPSMGQSGPVSFWQNVFLTNFLVPLADTPTDGCGVLTIDVTETALRQAIINAPPGNPSGRELITVTLSDGAHELDLTLAPK